MRSMLVVLALLAWSLGAPTARAQVADHLQCYKIKDPVALKGIVDVDTPQFGVAAGCASIIWTLTKKYPCIFRIFLKMNGIQRV